MVLVCHFPDLRSIFVHDLCLSYDLCSLIDKKYISSFSVIQNPAVRLSLNLPPLESHPTPAQVQPLNLLGRPESSPGVDSPISDKECEQSSSVLSTGVDSPIADKECEQSSSVLSDRIRDLEIRAKSRGGSQA
jgi:YidC/Oxa1 family membrane protein insertase